MNTEQIKTKRSFLTSFLFLLGALVFLACGKMGAPVPPDDLTPTASGGDLRTLDTFLIKRSTFVRPGRGANAVESVDAADLRLVENREIAEVRFDRTRGLGALNQPVVYLDRTVRPGVIYEYSIQAVGSDGKKSSVRSLVRALFRGRASQVRVY